MNMKTILAGLSLAVLVCGCASVPPGDTPFNDYKSGMASEPNDPMAAEWQDANREALEAATKYDGIVAILRSPAACEALLARVKGAYESDPIVLTQVGMCSQVAQCRKLADAKSCRANWCGALIRAAEQSTDSYRTMVFLDQLRWCGQPHQARKIRAIGAKSGDEGVKAFADMIADSFDKMAKK